MYLSVHAESKSTSSIMLLGYFWGGGGASEVGVRGHRGHRSPLPPLSQPPPGPSRGRRRPTRRDIRAELDPPPAKRHLTRSCPVSGQRRLPAAWMQPGRTLGFFAVERGGGESFILAPRFPTTADAKRAEMTGAAVRSGG